MDIKLEITPEPFKAYEVTRNDTGASECCILSRGTWNVVETGKFFAYEHEAYVEGEVSKCSQCGKWEMFAIGKRCQECAHFVFYMEVG